MVQRQPERAVDFLAMPYIAGEGQRVIGVSDPVASRFRAARIARKHHHVRALVRKNFGNRFSNSIEAPVTTATFPFISMATLVSPRVQSRQPLA